jgi:predicted TIM-barrel fold metal-dependent hydrolase
MHTNVPMPGKITMVSHMMDLPPVYNQTEDGTTLLSFQPQQLDRMERFTTEPGAGLYYFVAYNPYRDDQAAGDGTNALELVRHAIQQRGARGVKVYPPSGYRAAGNKIKPRPCALFTRYPGWQWDRRYGKFEPRDAAVDQELETLLEWCIAEDLPVFVHSGYGEFEARKGYGEYHSDPKFWKDFLESHSAPGAPCRLRLCLGHAGGEDYWFGNGTRQHAEWGKTVHELCTTYPNVYCEVTTSEAMIEPTTQAHFVDRIVNLYQQSERSGSYPFSKKLLYGTDWPLPDRGEPAAVLLATQQAFIAIQQKVASDAANPGRAETAGNIFSDYFSGNAKRFLKLEALKP